MAARWRTKRATFCARHSIRSRRSQRTLARRSTPIQVLRWFRLARGAPRTDARAADLRRMIVLDTNVVPELMKSAPEPAVMVWINALPGSAVFISAITQAETLYGVALVPEGKRREGLARAARTASETYFRGRFCRSTPKLPRRSPRWPPAAAGLAGRFHRRTLRSPQSPDPAERLLPPAMCRILRGAGSKSSTLGVRRRDTSQADQLKTEDRLPWRRPANNANAEVVGLECMPDVSPRRPRPSKINGFAGKAPKRVTAIRWATAA
jgi:hypothetical protein